MTTTPEVKLRLSIDGARVVQDGVERVGAALDNSASQALALGAASAQAAAAQAELAKEAARNAAAQQAAANATAQAAAAQQRIASAQSQSAAGMGAAAQAAGRMAQAQSALGTQTRMTGQQAAQMSAQLQDLFIQIQAGGSPMTALIQQGSQLSAVFGGMGNALKAVGSLISPAVIAIGAVAGAAATLGAAFVGGWRQSRELADALALTGNAAGVTTGQFEALAVAIGDRTQVSAGVARDALQQVVASGKIAGQAVQSVASAAAAMSRVTGDDATDIARKFVGMSDDIAGAARKLNEQYNFLTAAQYAQIKAAAEAGDTNRAISMTFGELEARMNATQANLGTLERGWASLTKGLRDYLYVLQGIGRTEGTEQQIKALENRIAATRAGNFDRAELPGLERELETLKKAAFLEQERASAASRGAQVEKSRIKWIEDGVKYLSREKALAREIAQIRADASSSGFAADAPEVLERIKVATERHKEKAKAVREEGEAYIDGREAAREWARVMEQASDITEQAQVSTLGLNRAQALLRAYLTSPAYAQATDGMRQLALAQLYAADAAIKEGEAQRTAADAMEAARKEREAQTRAYQQQADSAEARITRLEDEDRAAMMAADGQMSLAKAIELVAIERLREAQAIEMSFGNDEAAEAIQREIKARERLAEVMQSRAVRDGNAKAAAEHLREWQRISDQVGQSLADALMEGGRSARDYLKGLFRNLVLQPILRPLTSAIGGFVAYGASGGAYAGQEAGGGQLMSLANSYSALSKAYEYYTGTGSGSLSGAYASAYQSFATSAAGQSMGLSSAATIGNNASAYVAPQMTATGEAVGALGQYAGYAAIGQVIGRGISGGYSALGGNSGSTAVNVGTALGTVIGAWFGSPNFGAAIGAALGGVVNRAFGRKAPEVTERGIEGSFDASGFSGNAYQDILEKGGWFRSDKNYTVTSAINSDIDKALDEGAAKVRESVTKYTDALGLPAEQMGTVTEKFRIAVTDNEAENTKAVAEALGKYSNALVGAFAVDIEPLRRANETVADAIVRLGANLTGVNDVLTTLGATALQTSLQGADAASKLADVFGGLSGFTSATNAYYQEFFSQAEKSANLTRALGEAFTELGTSVPTTREEFKALVNAQDLMTESGRETFAALMSVSGAFDALQDSADQIAARRAELDIELLRAQGKETEALALERQKELEALRELDPALAQVKEMIYAAVDAAKEAEKWKNVWAGVDSVIGDFLGGEDLARYRAERIQDVLGGAGIDSSVEGIIGATKDDILALWEAVGVDGKQAILDAYGAWKLLQEELAQSQIEELISGIGSSVDDLLAAYNELHPAADGLVAAWRKNVAEIERLQSALDEFTGAASVDAIDKLRTDIANRDGLRNVIAGNEDTLAGLMAERGDPRAVDALRAREAKLWAEYAQSPTAEVAQAITRLTLDRIRLEGTIEQQARQQQYDTEYQQALAAYQVAQATVTLEEQARNAQMDALREQISAAERLKDLAANSAQFLAGVRGGSLSNLSYEDRLSASSTALDLALQSGQGADAALTTYLQQAQQTYGGATGAYSHIFDEAVARYEAQVKDGAAGADQAIATAQSQLAALEALVDQAPQLQQAVIDTSQAQIDALLRLNETFGGTAGVLTTSIDKQIKALEDQLKALEELRKTQEGQITTYAEGVIAINERLDKLVGSVGSIKTTVETEAARA